MATPASHSPPRCCCPLLLRAISKSVPGSGAAAPACGGKVARLLADLGVDLTRCHRVLNVAVADKMAVVAAPAVAEAIAGTIAQRIAKIVAEHASG